MPTISGTDQRQSGQLIARIRSAHPDLLIAAYTMPRGERRLAANLAALGVPVGVNVGAAIDFAAGRVHRAPRRLQKAGLEWAFRLALEPRRLFARYARNAWFILRMVTRRPDPAAQPVSRAAFAPALTRPLIRPVTMFSPGSFVLVSYPSA